MKWFWMCYRWLWWRLPGNRERYRELLLKALREDKFTFQIRHITDEDWVEHIRKPDQWSEQLKEVKP